MASCQYDNPITARREQWKNGAMAGHCYSRMLIEQWYSREYYLRHGSNLYPWKPGKIVGDPAAMEGVSNGR